VHDNKRLKYVSFFYYTHVKKSKISNQQSIKLTRQKRASSAKTDSLSAKEADSEKLGNDDSFRAPLGLPRALGLRG